MLRFPCGLARPEAEVDVAGLKPTPETLGDHFKAGSVRLEGAGGWADGGCRVHGGWEDAYMRFA